MGRTLDACVWEIVLQRVNADIFGFILSRYMPSIRNGLCAKLLSVLSINKKPLEKAAFINNRSLNLIG